MFMFLTGRCQYLEAWLPLSCRQLGTLNLTQQENSSAGLRNANDWSLFPRQKQGRAYVHWAKMATWQCIFAFIFIRWFLKIQVWLDSRRCWGKGGTKALGHGPPDSWGEPGQVEWVVLWSQGYQVSSLSSDLIFSASGNPSVKYT